ncbi:MAG: tRNA N6-adenosine threonylcarbamoyltransferase [Thermodesulfobacteriota bacterium]|nr:tRNA N6-adenosine threonylcarbamoyltransferase [Thermodesulfobacteriota bacterium]
MWSCEGLTTKGLIDRKTMYVLGIETSCDETAASVVFAGREVLSNVVVSQIRDHARYGGVVPELASRKHSEVISMVLDTAMEESGIPLEKLAGIAVTRGPGLIGSLLVGIGAAKGIAMALDIPICGVNHVHGHLFAALLEYPSLRFPFVGLVVSGGHTSLYHVKGHHEIQLLGKTRDDAAGEAFDKVAKLLGLGYPGGPTIENRSMGINRIAEPFPQALIEKYNLDFSFSGLKTAVLRRVEKAFGRQYDRGRPGSFHRLVPEVVTEKDVSRINNIAAAFQDSITEVLTTKLFWAAETCGVDTVVVCGGVAVNGSLRRKVREQSRRSSLKAIFPSPGLCTDNAAMIAARGATLISSGMIDDLCFDARSRW